MTAPLVDRISRLLAAPASRRSFLAGAAGAAGAAAATAVPALAAAGNGNGNGNSANRHSHGSADADAETGAARKRGGNSNRNGNDGRGRGRGDSGNAGMCRTSGSCSRGADCCSGRCAGRNGRKRCRCLAEGAACANQQACCSGLACVEGACRENGAQTPPPAPAQSCDVCASGCRFASVEAAWAATPDGGVISIAPGTWPATVSVDRSMTLEACEGRDGVVLEPRAGSGSVLLAPAAAPANLTLTLSGLTFRTTDAQLEALIWLEAPGIAAKIRDCRFDLSEFGVMITSDGGDVSVSGSVFTGIGGELGAGLSHQSGNGALAIEDSSFSDCSTGVVVEFSVSGRAAFESTEFAGCSTGLDVTGPATGLLHGNVTAFVTGCRVTGNTERGIRLTGAATTIVDSTIDSNGGPAAYAGGISVASGKLAVLDTRIAGNVGLSGGILASAENGPATLSLGDGVTISGNTATDFGGGLALIASTHPVQLQVTGGNVAITGNSAPRASGVAVVTSDRAGVSAIGVNTQVVAGNGPGMQCMTSRNQGRAFSEVATCVFGF